MKRRTFLKLAGAAALSGPLARPALAQAATVRWWYHFDNPQHSPAELIAKFEQENPMRRTARWCASPGTPVSCR
jgi:multiple sugar transport system substrate-binding protein